MKKSKNRYLQSEKLLERALDSIPLGSQTFSKSKTQLSKGVSPFFAKKAKGAILTDVDGNDYIDFVSSLASITLGYNDEDVLNAVSEQLQLGTIFSLPCELEILVAEKIISLVPCAESVRFGKNGSDATAGAIRAARSYTNREHVIVCGYHGWQDWYIGSTARNAGVPKSTQALTHTFTYNDIESLKSKFETLKDQVAAVIMEPMNVFEPKPGFLDEVKRITHQNGALLIFDETITGFRYDLGGAQNLFGVTPDLATFGKGLANGYPLSAIAGRKDIMGELEKAFFSFTFGGEALSLAASLATLHKLESQNILGEIKETGIYLLKELDKVISEFDLNDYFKTAGHPTWSFIIVQDTPFANMWELKSLLQQEMFANGIYMIGSHNLNFAIKKAHIDKLMSVYRSYFGLVIRCKNGTPISELLESKVLEPLFKVR